MTPAFLFAVYALAVARVAVLITEDRITEAPRTALIKRIRERAAERLVDKARYEVTEGGSRHTWDDAMERDLRAIYRRDVDPYAEYLLSCQWCIGMWLSFAAAPAWYFLGDSPWFLIPACALAFSYVAGKLSQFGG